MGGGASKKKTEQELAVNMLLLGAPSVGKSTIFRQMKLLYRDGFTEKERRRSRIELRRNLLASILKLDEVALNLGLNLSSNDAEEAITKLKIILSDYDYDERDDENCVEAQQEGGGGGGGDEEEPEFPAADIRTALADPSIQQALQSIRDPEFKLDENDVVGRELIQTALPYVMDNLDRILSDSFLPTNNDCLHIRRHTTNVERIHFDCEVDMNGKPEVVKCTCTDIGGQAQEQQKWDEHSSSIDFLVFVAAMSDFDRILPDGTNSLTQQFHLLNNVLQASCFASANVVVILNKSDVLEEKLKHLQLSSYYDDFVGNNNRDDAERYFQEKCALLTEAGKEQAIADAKAQGKPPPKSTNRQVQFMSTCALDTQMVNNVLKSALSASLCSALMSFGLIV